MLSLKYAILYYHSIKLVCFHYNGSAGVSFLLQQCIHFSEVHSDYWAIGLLDLRIIGLSDYRTIAYSDYWAFELLGHRISGLTPFFEGRRKFPFHAKLNKNNIFLPQSTQNRGEHANHYTTDEPTIYQTRGEHANHYTTDEPTIYQTRDEHA